MGTINNYMSDPEKEGEYTQISKIREELICPICLQLLTHPVSVCERNCIFCEECAQRNSEESNRCPICRSLLKKAVRIAVLDSVLKLIKTPEELEEEGERKFETYVPRRPNTPDPPSQDFGNENENEIIFHGLLDHVFNRRQRVSSTQQPYVPSYNADEWMNDLMNTGVGELDIIASQPQNQRHVPMEMSPPTIVHMQQHAQQPIDTEEYIEVIHTPDVYAQHQPIRLLYNDTDMQDEDIPSTAPVPARRRPHLRTLEQQRISTRAVPHPRVIQNFSDVDTRNLNNISDTTSRLVNYIRHLNINDEYHPSNIFRRFMRGGDHQDDQ